MLLEDLEKSVIRRLYYSFDSSRMEIIMVALLFYVHETDNEVYAKQRTVCWMTVLNLVFSMSHACKGETEHFENQRKELRKFRDTELR